MENKQLTAYEEVLERILNVKRVQGYVIIDEHGLKVNEKIESTTALQYAHFYSEIASTAKSLIRDLDPTSDLLYFRVKTKQNEALAAIADDEIYVVIQNPETNLFGLP